MDLPHRWTPGCVSLYPSEGAQWGSPCAWLMYSQVCLWCAQAGARMYRCVSTCVGVSAPFCLLLDCSHPVSLASSFPLIL